MKPESLEKAKRAIQEFIDYIRENEPGTQIYTSLQIDEDPTEFLHYLIFDNAESQGKHKTSEGVKRFTSILYTELASEGAALTHYTLAASTK